jgi:hypothetical protein
LAVGRSVAAVCCAVLLAAPAAALAAQPETTIDSGPQGLNTAATPTFTFSSNVAGSTFECSLDRAPFTACASPFQLPQLTQGPHVFDVRAISPSTEADSTPAERAWTYLPSIAAPVIDLRFPRAAVKRSKLTRLAGIATAASGVKRIDVALMLSGSRHDVPGDHPPRCKYANLRNGRLVDTLCVTPRWRRARGTVHWQLALSKAFRAHIRPHRYVVMVRGLNELGAEKVYRFSRTIRR